MKEYRNDTIIKVITDFIDRLLDKGVNSCVVKNDEHQTVVEINIPNIIVDNDVKKLLKLK